MERASLLRPCPCPREAESPPRASISFVSCALVSLNSCRRVSSCSIRCALDRSSTAPSRFASALKLACKTHTPIRIPKNGKKGSVSTTKAFKNPTSRSAKVTLCSFRPTFSFSACTSACSVSIVRSPSLSRRSRSTISAPRRRRSATVTPCSSSRRACASRRSDKFLVMETGVLEDIDGEDSAILLLALHIALNVSLMLWSTI